LEKGKFNLTIEMLVAENFQQSIYDINISEGGECLRELSLDLFRRHNRKLSRSIEIDQFEKDDMIISCSFMESRCSKSLITKTCIWFENLKKFENFLGLLYFV